MQKKETKVQMNHLIAMGKEKGCVTCEEVNDTFPADTFSQKQIDEMMVVFEELNIEIGEAPQKAGVPKSKLQAPRGKGNGEMKEATGKTSFDNLNEPVRAYLRAIGTVPLLSREEEVEIAKRIEDGEKEVAAIVLHVPLTIKKIISIGENLRSNTISARESVGNWRDTILNHLRDKGEVKAIHHIIEELPHLDWLARTLRKADEVYRRNSWRAPKPEELLELSKQNERRFVQSGNQLIDVINDSLNRLSKELHDETPAVGDLWNNLGDGKYKPKTEPELSDYIKRFLDRDLKGRGIIINREVQIHRGQRTDIHVDAINFDGSDKITAIIEVKGCWHEDLLTAMKTQLVERYLHDNQCQHGIYLVGWFKGEHWDRSDYRLRKTLDMSIDALIEELLQQAENLSKNGLSILNYVLDATL